MLVLSRHRDESIMLGDDVKITIVDIRGDKVRLGIEAPKELSVDRKEVWDAKKSGRQSSTPSEARNAQGTRVSRMDKDETSVP